MPCYKYLEKVCLLIFLSITLTISPVSATENHALLELLKVLHDKGTLSATEYELLRETARSGNRTTQASQAEKPVTTGETPAAKTEITTKDKLVLASRDADFRWQPLGRIMADYNFVDSDRIAYGSGTELRRARLGMDVTLWGHWIGKIEYDWGNSSVAAKDVYVGYKDQAQFGHWWIKLGNQHVPFGFTTLSSSKYMNFISRAQYADGPLHTARMMGLAAFAGGDRWTFHTGVFMGEAGEDPDECGTVSGECDEQVGLAARLTGIPLDLDPTHMLAIGGAVWLRDTRGSTIDIDQRPAGTHTTDYKPFNIDFEGDNVDHISAWTLDAVGIYGPFHIMAEYTWMQLSQNGLDAVSHLAGDYDVSGWSVAAGIFLTGESKNYDRKKARFGSIKPNYPAFNGGIGAWEVAIRYENMDLNDPAVTIYGGNGDLLTIGVNWYINNTMRFMANYAQVTDFSRPGSSEDGDEPGAYLFRGQIYW